VAVGDADQSYLNSGDPDGPDWVVGECDVSIRPGWFYHKKEDDKVKTPQQLINLYYKSVGRNGTLLLNIPPDQRGLIHENDIQSLKGFQTILKETFETNLARGAKVQSTSQWSRDTKFQADNIVDEDMDSYWAAKEGDGKPMLTLNLGDPVTFDRLMIQEPIRLGQRISKFSIEAQVDRKWKEIASATTVGHKRLLRFEPVTASKIRIKIMQANNTAAISNFGLYKASAKE